MGMHYYKEHSFGMGLRKVILKVFNKREIRNIDSIVPYCDIFVNGKQKRTIRVNKRGNNKPAYKARDLISKAHSFYVRDIVKACPNLDVIMHRSRKFYRGLLGGC